MITASIGSHRFESGPTYHLNNSNFEALSGVVHDPNPTVDYVNQLPGVDATPEEVRQVAASGITRLAVGGSELDILELAGNTLIDACDGKAIDTTAFTDLWSNHWWGGTSVFHSQGLANGVLDSASVLATRKNRPEETAEAIREKAPTDEGYFVIALANGGLISAARTFLRLEEGNHSFGVVKYSRHKGGDKEPRLHPYPDERRRWLEQMARGRQVVVFDEDYGTKETLTTATKYFAGLFEKKVLGIAPVEVSRRITYSPLVITAE
jgi:hypothetical protein